MFVKVSDTHIINTDQIVEVEIHPAREEKVMASYEEAAEYDFPENNIIRAAPLRVEIITSAFVGDTLPKSYGSDEGVGVSKAHVIRLDGEEAELFLQALPVYEPVKEDA